METWDVCSLRQGITVAIAAAFKAPIAGVFFALEIVLNGAFEVRSFTVIVLAAVVSFGLIQALDLAIEMGPFKYSLGALPSKSRFSYPRVLVWGSYPSYSSACCTGNATGGSLQRMRLPAWQLC